MFSSIDLMLDVLHLGAELWSGQVTTLGDTHKHGNGLSTAEQ